MASTSRALPGNHRLFGDSVGPRNQVNEIGVRKVTRGLSSSNVVLAAEGFKGIGFILSFQKKRLRYILMRRINIRSEK